MPCFVRNGGKTIRKLLALCLVVTLISLAGWVYLHQAPKASAASGSQVLVGAGDIASCEERGDSKTAHLLNGIPGTVFTTGDNAYDSETTAQFRNCYESPGFQLQRTRQ